MDTCQKIEDIQDLALDLFDTGPQEDLRQKARRERVLKRKPKAKPKVNVHADVEDNGMEVTNGDQEIKANQKELPGSQKIYVKTFGCSHNISDSEFMIGQLVEYGYHMVESTDQADLVLINSCTVVNPSQDAFISMLNKAKKVLKPVVVAGCVPQGQQTLPELMGVSAIGVTQLDRVVEVVEDTLKGYTVQLLAKKDLPALDLPKIRKNKVIEIIPINAGCLGACTYCKTVFARGKLISYAPQAIVDRVKTVALAGIREIWLTSQDTGAYGLDRGSNIAELLIALCEQLQKHPNLMLRIGMTNPPYMLGHLTTLAKFLNHPRVFSFVHVPVQAGHDTVLAKMNRQYTVQDFTTVVDYFLEAVPQVTIATDIICGFAEETEEQFQASIDLVDHYRFRVVNINQFYLRPGTPAANLKQLSSKVVKARSSRLTDKFKSYDHHSYLIGHEERVWINESQTHKGVTHLVGHTKNYTKVILPFDEQLLFKQVILRITAAFPWHVEGEIIDRQPQPLAVDSNYVKSMKEGLQAELDRLAEKKKTKAAQSKEKLLQLRLKRQSVPEKQFQHKGSCGVNCTCNKNQCNTNINCSCSKQDSPVSEKQKIDQQHTDFEHQIVSPTSETDSKPRCVYLLMSLLLLMVGVLSLCADI